MKSIWKSEVTADMVAELDSSAVDSLIEELDKAVEAVCADWGL